MPIFDAIKLRQIKRALSTGLGVTPNPLTPDRTALARPPA